MTDQWKPLTDEDLTQILKNAIKGRALLTECGIDVTSFDDVERLVVEVRQLRNATGKPERER
jgi:hypothetical protein